MDGTGPMGQGPMTGRGMGPCGGGMRRGWGCWGCGLRRFISPKNELAALEDEEKMLEEEHIDKKVKEIFGEVTEEARDLYLKTKKELIKRLSELKETIEHIDREKYETVVKETVDIIKKEAKKEGKEMEKLKEALLKEWKKLEGKKK